MLLWIYLIYTALNMFLRRDRFRFHAYYVPFYYQRILTHPEPGFTILPDTSRSRCPFVSVSIYGTHPRYYDGLTALIQQVPQVLPHWNIRVYCHDMVPIKYQNMMRSHRHVELVMVHDPMVAPGNSSGMFWRFMPAAEKGRRFIVLDIDEELKPDILHAIDIWEKSNLPYFRLNLHTSTDNPSNVLWPEDCWVGGKWGCDGSVSIPASYLSTFPHRSTFGSDECWLLFVLSPFARAQGLCTVYKNRLHAHLAKITLWPPQHLSDDHPWRIPSKSSLINEKTYVLY